MKINTKSMVSITEANQNFSKVARLVDEVGSAVILKNNTPRYLVIDFAQAETEQTISDEDIMDISKRLIAQNKEAYKELAEWYKFQLSKWSKFIKNSFAKQAAARV